MPNTLTILSLLLLIGRISLSISLRPPPLLSPEKEPCHRPSPPNTLLRSDQLTVLINGYSESRIPLLRSLAAAYSASPTVAAVLVLWGNPSTPSQTLAFLSHNLSASASAAPISLLRQPSPSLNLRFLPRPSSIPTRAVLICDDDVEIDPKSLDFAFKVWAKNPNRLVGFFARSHDIDLSRRGEWIYTVHPDKYSIMLTKIMIAKTENLYNYSCRGGQEMAEARTVVDRMRNCEDILMNFVVAEEEKAGPVLVGGERVRDWGDARNEAGEEREVGLSSRRRDHRKRRGECIREFHRIFGRMPLRYSYGKVVDSVGEQGLCDKGGKLVFCDQQV
ncbi:Glycosyltransferase family protein like [Actinidia chinensis var. chinensis]|uniref:Glycosyltransferase family protein like n=1 Tax=Actinidia chinensis var. chinensis TaxID=1590841 RepID=A0A2R6QPC1_ACTCC|nr:Glycosyltransferase family protein like [Actinidia chinensis var. chinensis]